MQINTRKIFFYFLTVLVGTVSIFALLEIALQLEARSRNTERNLINKVEASDGRKLRILAIGESTTDAIFAMDSKAVSWPQQLEESLNRSGISTRVYNVGTSGVSNYFLMQNLRSNIKDFKPHIVVAMMGINDGTKFGSFEDRFSNHLKVFRLKSNFLDWRKLSNRCQLRYSSSAVVEGGVSRSRPRYFNDRGGESFSCCKLAINS